MDKEWNSILDKGVFDLIDITDVPKNVEVQLRCEGVGFDLKFLLVF